MQLSIVAGGNSGEHLHIRRPASACIQHHVEVIQKQLPISGRCHYSAALAAIADFFRPVERLGKMQTQLVNPRLQRDIVLEIALPAAAVDIRVLRTPDMLDGAAHALAA